MQPACHACMHCGRCANVAVCRAAASHTNAPLVSVTRTTTHGVSHTRRMSGGAGRHEQATSNRHFRRSTILWRTHPYFIPPLDIPLPSQPSRSEWSRPHTCMSLLSNMYISHLSSSTMRRPHSTILNSSIFLLSLLCLLSSLPSSVAQCANGDVTCSVCDHSSRGNDISGLPRINARGHLIPSNIGSYSWYECDAFGHNCHSFLSKPQYSHWLNKMPNDTHPINYVQSVVVYVLFGVACLLLSLTCGFSLCCCRYWYDRDMGGLCGGVHPQRRLRWIGVVIDPEDKRWKYTWKERWFARALMLTFVVLIWTWVGLGYFNGTATLPSAAKDTITSPAGMASTLQSTQQPVLDLLVAMGSGTLVHAVQNVSVLFTDVVSLSDMVRQMECISGPVHALPSLDGVDGLLANITSVDSVISAVQLQMDADIAASVLSLTEPLTAAAANLSLYAAASPSDDVMAVVANLTALLNYTDNVQVESGKIAPPMTTFTRVAPTAANLSTLAYAANASLARLIPDNTTTTPITNSTERSLLVYRWGNFTSTLASLPSLASVASAIHRYNSDLVLAAAQLDSVLAAVNQTMETAAVWDGYFQSVSTTLTNYQATTASFSLTSELALVSQLNASVLGLLAGQQSQLTAEIMQLSDLSTVLPCMSALLPLIDITNTEVITLSGNISGVLAEYADELNATLPAIVATLTNFSSELTSITSGATTLLNFSSVLSALTNASGTIAGLAGQLDLTNYNTLATLHQSIVTQLDPSADYDTLSALSSVLSAAVIPDSFTATLTAYDIYYQSLLSNFTALTSDLALWSGTMAGNKRCKRVQATPCVYNKQCTVTDSCVLDYDRVALLEKQIGNYSTHYPSFTAMTATAAQVILVNTTLANDGVRPMQAQLTTTVTLLIAEDEPIDGVMADLDDVIYRLDNYSATADIDNQFTALLATVDATLNFSATIDQLDSFNTTLATIEANLPAFDSSLQLLNTLNTFLFTTFPQTFNPQLTNLSYPATDFPESAVANLTLQLAEVVNEMLAVLDSVPAINDSVGAYDFIGRSDNVRSYLDLVYSSDYSTYGAIYYFGSIYNAFDDAITVLNPNNLLASSSTNATAATFTYDAYNWAVFDTFNADANRVNAYAGGNAYPSGTLCLTDNCLRNTVDYYTNNGLKTITGGTVPIPVTAPHLNGLLFLIPAFIAALGLAAMLAWKKYEWASGLATATVVLLLVFLPLIFVFALVLFPALMIQADVCYGGLNLGYNVLVQQRDTICTMIGGTGPADDCVYTLDGFDININIPALYQDVLGGQCDSTVTDNAVLAMFNSIRDSAMLWPDEKVAKAIINFNNNTEGLTIQPLLAAVLHSAAAETSTHLQDFITSLSSELSCDALHASFSTIKSSFCCSVTSSLYWFFGSWFLIGLTSLVCGVPAAVCGRKRFAAEIPDKELRIIDRYFSKDRVLREEGYMKKARSSVENAGHLRRRSKGSVAPLDDDVNAIEMAYARAEREKAEVNAALKAIDAAERAHKDRSGSSSGGRGEAGDGGLVRHARGSRPDMGAERIDVIVASPSASNEPSQNSVGDDAADVDDRRGLNARLGGGGNVGRKRPSALQHPMGLNQSRTSLGAPYNDNHSVSNPAGADFNIALTPSPIPVTPLAYTDVDEEKLPATTAPTPLAILVHRPSAPAARGGGGVFSYGEDSDGEAEADDVASYARKWPSLSGRDEEEKKAIEQQRTPSLSFAPSTPSAPPAIRPSIEGVRDAGEDSLDGDSTSEEDESSGDDDDAGNHMPTFR